MRVFYQYTYYPSKKELPADVFMRIREVAKWYSPKLQFAFKDRSGRKVSGVKRIAKMYPEIVIVELKDDFGHKFLCLEHHLELPQRESPHSPGNARPGYAAGDRRRCAAALSLLDGVRLRRAHVGSHNRAY